jgi:FdrA protein
MAAVVNRVRRTFYMDSVALMRISTKISSRARVDAAALLIGSVANKNLLRNAGLMSADCDGAGANDLIIAVRAEDDGAAAEAIKEAEVLLDAAGADISKTIGWGPKTLEAALQEFPSANLALISVPGEFAAAEARRAIENGLNVLLFSDNVSVAEEIELKREARRRGLLMMGPDCGTAIIGGAPLAFANVVPPGSIGIVAASGTGLQEVSTLLARNGEGISHGIGVGGRDLNEAIGGITMFAAIDALDRDPGTRHVVLISKPPAPAVAKLILDRVGESPKTFTICFLGVGELRVPPNAGLVSDLRSAAEQALSGKRIEWADCPDPSRLAARIGAGRGKLLGLFSGGTLCAEAQIFLRRVGLPVRSNAPIPGVDRVNGDLDDSAHVLLDVGDDAFTVGRPHPIIDPTLRNQKVAQALNDANTGVILLDVVIGYGASPNPAEELIMHLPPVNARKALLITSICGTEADPQCYSRQRQQLDDAGIVVAPSNAHAAELATSVVANIAAART